MILTRGDDQTPAVRSRQLKIDRPANTEDKAIDIIPVGFVFVLHVLGIRRDGKIIIKDKTPVDLGDLGLVDIILTVQIGVSDTDVVVCPSIPFAGDVETAGIKVIVVNQGFVIITIHPLVLIGSGQKAFDGKLVCDIIPKRTRLDEKQTHDNNQLEIPYEFFIQHNQLL